MNKKYISKVRDAFITLVSGAIILLAFSQRIIRLLTEILLFFSVSNLYCIERVNRARENIILKVTESGDPLFG
jgi:hypothetical protein